MASGNYVFTLTPTFTQGLVLGQLSILILLACVLKFLFLDTEPGRQNPTFHPARETFASDAKPEDADQSPSERDGVGEEGESADWFNEIARHVLEAYRARLRDHLPGAEGDEVARRKIEEFANRMRPAVLVDPIRIHSVDLGSSAPRLSNIRVTPRKPAAALHIHPRVPNAKEPEVGAASEAEFDMTYRDVLSVSLSTGVLLNYPVPAFARLPVSLTISLELFSAPIIVTPPIASSDMPTLTISIPPDGFTLNLRTTSLIGSRAKLADVPKLHELIQHQIRRAVAERKAFTFVLPGLSSVSEVKEAIRHEQEQ